MNTNSIFFTDTISGGIISSIELSNSSFEFDHMGMKIEITFPDLRLDKNDFLPPVLTIPSKFGQFNFEDSTMDWGDAISFTSDFNPVKILVKRVAVQVSSDLESEILIERIVSCWDAFWRRLQVWIEIFTEQNLATGTTYLNRGKNFVFSKINSNNTFQNHIVAKIFEGPVYEYKTLTRYLMEAISNKISLSEEPTLVTLLLNEARLSKIALDSRIAAVNAFVALEIILTKRIEDLNINPDYQFNLGVRDRKFDLNKSTLGTKVQIYQELDPRPIKRLTTDLVKYRNKLFHEGLEGPQGLHEEIIELVQTLMNMDLGN